MAKHLGRNVILNRGTGVGEAPVANMRTKSISINRELVDVTDDDSSGWAAHLAEAGQMDVTISVEGVISDRAFLGTVLDPTLGNETYTLVYPDGGQISGSFGVTSFSNENSYNEASTYSFELRANGAVTYTAPV